jgi:hypothetical protein
MRVLMEAQRRVVISVSDERRRGKREITPKKREWDELDRSNRGANEFVKKEKGSVDNFWEGGKFSRSPPSS